MKDEQRIAGPVIRTAAILWLLFLAFLLANRSFSANSQLEEKYKPKSISPTEGARSSAQSGGALLGQLIEQAINQSRFADARWGVSVISLNDGQVVYSRNGDKLFTPASNLKLYTTAAALDLLGANYIWRTSVYADKQPDGAGILQGDLVLYGRGAPDLISESSNENRNSLSEIAEALVRRGLRRVTGNVIGDESYFRGEPIGDGWLWNDLQWYYGAEASALSVNSNEVEISILPPEKSGDPPTVRSSDTSGLVRLTPKLATVKAGERFLLGIQRGLSDNNVRVWGEFPYGNRGYGAQLAVHKPALWTTLLFVDALTKKGIVVDGQPLARDARVPQSERFDPSQSNELTFVTSKPLINIITATNKHSINLSAELILRTLGRERGPMLGEPPPGRERGDDEAGRAVITLWLEKVGIAARGLAIHDGSGLSRLNLVTPDSAARLLWAMSRTNSGQLFRETLPVSGRDGTLRGRLGSLENRVFAKTGLLTYDNSLSGYILAENGETLAFSVFCNDQTGPGNSVQLIDQIALLIAQYPQFNREKVENPRLSSR